MAVKQRRAKNIVLLAISRYRCVYFDYRNSASAKELEKTLSRLIDDLVINGLTLRCSLAFVIIFQESGSLASLGQITFRSTIIEQFVRSKRRHAFPQ